LRIGAIEGTSEWPAVDSQYPVTLGSHDDWQLALGAIAKPSFGSKPETQLPVPAPQGSLMIRIFISVIATAARNSLFAPAPVAVRPRAEALLFRQKPRRALTFYLDKIY